jgi:RNA polymerase sigma factor (sigma-70 family)
VRGILLKALENLAAPLRVVFTLRYVEGWSCEETGRMLGLSPETVRVRSLRARRRLRRTLSFLFENGALLATR